MKGPSELSCRKNYQGSKYLTIFTTGSFNHIPTSLDPTLGWTGKGDFVTSHGMKSRPNPSAFKCLYDRPVMARSGGCFLKASESYRIGAEPIVSPPLTCRSKGRCRMSAQFVIDGSEQSLPGDSLPSDRIPELIEPNCPLKVAHPRTVINQTVTIEFQGPGTRRILFKPIFWSVTGLFRDILPRGFSDSQQLLVSFDFPILVGGRGDGVYSIVDSNFERCAFWKR